MFRVLEQFDQLKLTKARALFLSSNTPKFKEYANFYASYLCLSFQPRSERRKLQPCLTVLAFVTLFWLISNVTAKYKRE